METLLLIIRNSPIGTVILLGSMVFQIYTFYLFIGDAYKFRQKMKQYKVRIVTYLITEIISVLAEILLIAVCIYSDITYNPNDYTTGNVFWLVLLVIIFGIVPTTVISTISRIEYLEAHNRIRE